MNARDFVNGVRAVVLDGAVRAIRQTLEKPPGRRPKREWVEISDWYNSLSASDRAMVLRVVTSAAHAAVFNLFALLDGVTTIEDDPVKGNFILLFRGAATDTILNDPRGVMLHDLLNEEGP